MYLRSGIGIQPHSRGMRGPSGAWHQDGGIWASNVQPRLFARSCLIHDAQHHRKTEMPMAMYVRSRAEEAIGYCSGRPQEELHYTTPAWTKRLSPACASRLRTQAGLLPTLHKHGHRCHRVSISSSWRRRLSSRLQAQPGVLPRDPCPSPNVSGPSTSTRQLAITIFSFNRTTCVFM